MKRKSVEGDGIQLKSVETVNGNAQTALDEEANAGTDGEDLVDYIPG